MIKAVMDIVFVILFQNLLNPMSKRVRVAGSCGQVAGGRSGEAMVLPTGSELLCEHPVMADTEDMNHESSFPTTASHLD